MNENVPFIWRKNYRNEAASPEKVLENAHEKARQYLTRAAAINQSRQRKCWRRRSERLALPLCPRV